MWPVHQDGKGSATRLGRYEILAAIGSGGMATIYLGKIAGPAGFEKPLALKVIHSHLVEDPQFVQMFFDEARIASQLQHPNIVQIFELGEAGGIFFIAMEYLRGENVGTVIQRVIGDGDRKMDPRIACHIIMEAAEGLHYAHELTSLDDQPLRLVHRDISPQNLFVTFNGSVKLMDFGIARAVGLAHSTRPGSLKGKFSYMSPEQVRGHEIDSRSDIFGLGVVLWEMLTGRRLFKGRNDLESLRLAGEANVTAVGSIRTGIPPELDRVLARALAKQPSDRYSTALEFNTDLGLVMDRLGSSITTHELAQRMKGWFGDEIEKKRKLLMKTASSNKEATDGGSPPTPMAQTVALDGTPSVSEPSGVRIRDIIGLTADSTTPSHSGAWDTELPQSQSEEPAPINISGSTQPGYPRSGEHSPTIKDEPSFSHERPSTEKELPAFAFENQPNFQDQSKSFADGVEALTLKSPVRAIVIVAGLLVGVSAVAVFVVYFLGYLSTDDTTRADPGLIGPNKSLAQKTPELAGATKRPRPVKIPTPEKITQPDIHANGLAKTEKNGVGAKVTTPTDSNAPRKTVKVSLTINAPSSKVTIDGDEHEDASNINLPWSSEPVKVIVSAPRYASTSFTFTPNRDLTKEITLRRRMREPRKQGNRPAKSNDLINSPYR